MIFSNYSRLNNNYILKFANSILGKFPNRQNSTDFTIELRSDTFTLPSTTMRKVMAEAEVGDDVYREDPTVNELEHHAANLLDKEAALFVPSGTMGNLIAMLVHCNRRGMEILLGDRSHISLLQQGGIAQLGGIHSRTIATNPDGTLDLNEIRSKIRTENIHYPETGLVCFENTHLMTGGQPLPLEYLTKIGDLKLELGIPIHLDGARIMNAAVYQRVPPSKIAEHFDSVCFCLSKGLGAPVGSILVGSSRFIQRSIRARKVLGGGMRQSGVLAAAGLYCLKNMIDRLEEDHENAKKIAEALAHIKTDLFTIDADSVRTNIIFLELNESVITGDEFCRRFSTVLPEEKKALDKSIAVSMTELENGRIRMVTHFNVNRKDVENVIQKFTYVLKEYEQKR